ncbi:MAG: 4'-phosphopantetheinyl transferase superfamily protein [Anderseniella sp.]|nr:4'-phosphopantetheinyl transferase superfamily protein [Anderseniella sp.]
MAAARDETGLTVAYARPRDVLHRLGTDSLDQTEHARAALMSNRARRNHFIAGRALLRHCLSAAVENAVQPVEWQFVNGAHGKPSVKSGLPQLHFSISHADGLIAVATSPVGQLGIDLELVTGARDSSPTVDQLTDREQAWLHQHGEADRWPAFLQLWTAKEAVSKATGLGCGLDFHDIEIDVPAGRARCPNGFLDFDLQTIEAHGATYCFSAAR